MHWNIKRIGQAICLAASVVVAGSIGGCASNRTDLVQSGYLTLDPAQAQANTLAHLPELYAQDGDLVVAGKLDTGEATRGGHVDVSVIAPGGTVVYDASVNYAKPTAQQPVGPRGQPRGTRTSAGNHAIYSVRFPGLPPQGSVVRVKHDPVPHAAKGGT